MDDIGSLLKETRISAGVNISEVSKDLSISELAIENIEDGKIGSFKDVFELKEILYNYSKYLGLESDKIIDDFNSYLFEYTSKIPVKEIEKTIELQMKEEVDKNKVISPYTKKEVKENYKLFIISIVVIIILVLLAMTWAIKQVAIGTSETTTVISYRK